MENTHTFIKRIENNPDFLELLNRGLMPFSILNRKCYYEYYLNDLKATESSIQSLFNTATEYNVSEMTIRRAIQFMEG